MASLMGRRSVIALAAGCVCFLGFFWARTDARGQGKVVEINIDPSGKIRLSRKALLSPEEGQKTR
jgi:hypothetical protein